jgi:hypothetical protein
VLIAASVMTGQVCAEEVESGFQSLFNGKNLDGWQAMNNCKFAAVDGVLKGDGGSGWLSSDKEYGDFVLRLEVRWLKPKQDSGVFLRASKEGANWPDRKYEVQAENTQRIAHIFGASCKRDADKAFKLLKPDGEWNALEISCIGTKCEVRLNGELASTADDLKIARGYLGFQGEGGQLQWRKIRIQEK